MKIIKTQINIGIKNPVRVLHLSDTHLTLADMRDAELQRSPECAYLVGCDSVRDIEFV